MTWLSKTLLQAAGEDFFLSIFLCLPSFLKTCFLGSGFFKGCLLTCFSQQPLIKAGVYKEPGWLSSICIGGFACLGIAQAC